MPRVKGSVVKPKTEQQKKEEAAKRIKAFKEIGGGRLVRAITAINALAKCSNRRSYTYEQADVTKLHKLLSDAVAACVSQYEVGLKGGTVASASIANPFI